jgi:TRAP-type mannitol/chloroaromatic compound transport system permease small subunit
MYDGRRAARSAFLNALLTAAHWIDRASDWAGRIVAWLTLGTVLICFATVYLRYALNIGLIWLQELYIWTHVAVIMFGAGYVLMRGGFVRVDILYTHMRRKARALVDLAGTVVFMGPFLVMMATSGWPFFYASYQMREASQQETGLAGWWILKATLMIFVVSVGVQGLSLAIHSLATLLGAHDDNETADKPQEVV